MSKNLRSISLVTLRVIQCQVVIIDVLGLMYTLVA